MTEKQFVSELERDFRADGFLTRKEIGVGYGIADLVLFRPNIQNCQRRIEHNQSRRLLHEGYFQVFSSLPDLESEDGPLNLDDLHQKTAYSRAFLKYTLLPFLKKAKYIRETKTGYYAKINGWLPIGEEMVAIEAKLHDWKRGFYQANRYRVFADKVYLAVPIDVVRLVDGDLLRDHGVGLIGFDAKNKKRQIVIEAATREPLNNLKRNLASEFFWNAQLRARLAA